jgi:large subunit ribosomal protein L23
MGIFNFLKQSRLRSGKSKPESVKEPTPIKKAPLKRKGGGGYQPLKEPHISEKATILSNSGKYVFRVYKHANKTEIKKAIANLYGVVVKDVKIINIKTKKRMLRGVKGGKHGYKKAIVTLEKGYKIEILPH